MATPSSPLHERQVKWPVQKSHKISYNLAQSASRCSMSCMITALSLDWTLPPASFHGIGMTSLPHPQPRPVFFPDAVHYPSSTFFPLRHSSSSYLRSNHPCFSSNPDIFVARFCTTEDGPIQFQINCRIQRRGQGSARSRGADERGEEWDTRDDLCRCEENLDAWWSNDDVATWIISVLSPNKLGMVDSRASTGS